MRLINQSRLPDDDVRELVRFAFRGVSDAGVVVKVKNRKQGACSGRAYQSVPYVSSEYGKTTVKMLVTIAIGPDSAFPSDNMVTTQRVVQTVVVPASHPGVRSNPYGAAREIAGSLDGDGGSVTFPAAGGAIVKMLRSERHPYGGKSSPLIEYRNWREGLVAVVAHESRHIHQFQARGRGKRTPLSEVDCEKHAAKRLAEYREHLAAEFAREDECGLVTAF